MQAYRTSVENLSSEATILLILPLTSSHLILNKKFLKKYFRDELKRKACFI
jgi:hypothetical protein